jgi:hypothetical protein
MAKRKQAHAGGHGWFVTFADLMGLLVSFFVMLVAFSNQDQKKLQIVAGSMRDAFGVQTNVRYSGVIEVDGLPTRPKLKNAAHIDPEDASATPTSDEQDHKREHGAHLKNDQAFALAAASLRQALQDMPELAEASKHTSWSRRPRRGSISISSIRRAARCFRRAPRSRTSDPPHHREARRTAQGHALSGLDHRPHLGIESAAQGGLWSLEFVRRPGQCGPANPRGRRLSAGQHLRGGRQGGYRSALSRGSLHCGQSPGDHHADARGAAGSPGLQP